MGNASLAGILFLAFAALSSQSMAEPVASGVVAEAGVSTTRFDYREYDDGGSVLDAEKAGIPGVSFKLWQRLAEWEWEGIASSQQGRADYAGETNTGVPYNTRTDETIRDVALRVSRHFEGAHSWALYGGLGYRRWDRDILPGTVGGLFESYCWPYIWLGTKIAFFQDERTQIMLDVGLLRPLSPQLRVDFEGTFAVSPTVYPESKFGVRMMLPSTFALSEKSFLNLEPYLDYWNLGSSPIVVAGPIAVHEPASRTRNFGLNIRLGRAF